MNREEYGAKLAEISVEISGLLCDLADNADLSRFLGYLMIASDAISMNQLVLEQQNQVHSGYAKLHPEQHYTMTEMANRSLDIFMGGANGNGGYRNKR